MNKTDGRQELFHQHPGYIQSVVYGELLANTEPSSAYYGHKRHRQTGVIIYTWLTLQYQTEIANIKPNKSSRTT